MCSFIPCDSPYVYGYLAQVWTGKRLPLQVLPSAAGHYIGTCDLDGPVSRESNEYFRSDTAAQSALQRHAWTQMPRP